MADEWVESTGMGETWDYKSLGEGAEIEGVYMGKDLDVGPNGSSMHYIDVNGGQVGVWGNAIIDSRTKNFVAGKEYIKIKYMGKKKSEKVKGREYNDFKVFHRPYNPKMEEVPATEGDLDAFEKSLGL